MMRWLSMLLMCSFITACGYHIAGSNSSTTKPLALAFKHISLEGLGQYETLRHILVPLLRSYGMRVMKPESAIARLVLVEKRTKANVVAVGEDAKAREYLLTMNVVFQIKVKESERGNIILPEQLIQESAPYLYAPNDLLVSQNERKRAIEEVENKIAKKMVSRIISLGAKLK